MKKTLIDLEDYYGNTLYRIEISKVISEDDVKIEGFDYADTDMEDEGSVLRFQRGEE